MLETEVAGITLQNPLMPASGPLTGDAEKMLAIASLGVGAMVTKTISTAAARVPRPCISGGRDFIMNAELWSEYGPERWAEEFLPAFRAAQPEKPLFVSAGYRPEELKKLIPRLDRFADAFEISTHYVGKDLTGIGAAARVVRACTDKPVFFKLSPHIPEPVAFAETVLEGGASGIVAVNSLGPTMAIDLQHRRVRFGNADGEVWTSGPVIRPLALALVHRIRAALPECAIIGAGGVDSAESVLEFLLAGADAVQMLSSAMLHGRELYAAILRNLPGALRRFGFADVAEVRRTPLDVSAPRYRKHVPKVDARECTACGVCARSCPYFAIGMNGRAVIDGEKCFGCGLCESLCPRGAISGTV